MHTHPRPPLALALLLALLVTTGTVQAAPLPPGFVHADEVVPGLKTDVRYASSHNFVGRPVAGYLAPKVILTKEAAQALAQVQARLRPFGLCLEVFDGYRPQRAVDDFVRWSKEPDDPKARAEFYPDVPKEKIIPLGYVAARSSHSRGSTVDLTLVALDGEGKELDMGGAFDLFSPRSAPLFPGITAQQRANRMLLRTLMMDAGFEPYSEEWWHFTLRGEPHPERVFDFPVE
ncbi:MAG: M15 family metallopeptidase [Deltaproteobacteria bacterium]